MGTRKRPKDSDWRFTNKLKSTKPRKVWKSLVLPFPGLSGQLGSVPGGVRQPGRESPLPLLTLTKTPDRGKANPGVFTNQREKMGEKKKRARRTPGGEKRGRRKNKTNAFKGGRLAAKDGPYPGETQKRMGKRGEQTGNRLVNEKEDKLSKNCVDQMGRKEKGTGGCPGGEHNKQRGNWGEI